MIIFLLDLLVSSNQRNTATGGLSPLMRVAKLAPSIMDEWQLARRLIGVQVRITSLVQLAVAIELLEVVPVNALIILEVASLFHVFVNLSYGRCLVQVVF